MYNIKMVSNMLGIPAVTLRAWERRYGLTPSARTNSGHRLYSDEDVEDLRWLKVQTEERGLSISHAVQNLFQQKEKNGQLSNEPQKRNRFVDIQKSIKESVLDYDSKKANEWLDYAFSLFQHEVVFQEIVVPLLNGIGQEWEKGSVSISQEHFATQLILQRFQQLWRAFPVNPRYPKMLAFCPGHERHHIGLLMFSLFLRKQGVPVVYLGPDTPLHEIETLVVRQNIQMICLSLTLTSLLQEIKMFIENTSTKWPDIKWVLGGQAFEHEEGWQDYLIGQDTASWTEWFQRECSCWE